MDWMMTRSASRRGGASIETRCAVVVAAGIEEEERDCQRDIVTIGRRKGRESSRDFREGDDRDAIGNLNTFASLQPPAEEVHGDAPPPRRGGGRSACAEKWLPSKMLQCETKYA
jgi:hypothetical protein